MEVEKQETQEPKKSFFKKKVIGIPMVVLMVMGIGFVLAAGTFFYMFTQTIQVHGVINHPQQPIPNIIPLVVTGDTHPVLNCTVGEYCYTGDITVYNPTLDNQTVYLSVGYPGNTVYGVLWTGDLGDTTNQYNTVVLAPNQTIAFTVGYLMNTNIADSITEFDSNILVTSNMTEYAR